MAHNKLSTSLEIIEAAETGNTAKVAELIEFGGEVNLPREDGITALMKAATGQHDQLAILLLKAGARVDYPLPDVSETLVALSRETVVFVTALLNLKERMFYLAQVSLSQNDNINNGYSVTLVGYEGRKTPLIKKLIELFDFSLKEAKEFVDSAPIMLSCGLSLSKAEQVRAALIHVGAQIEIIKTSALVDESSDIQVAIDAQWLTDPAVILEMSKRCPQYYQYSPDAFKNDRELLMQAVSFNGKVLKFASAFFRNDEKIVLAAVKNQTSALKYSSKAIKNNKTVVMKAVKGSGAVLEYASEKLCDDLDIVLAAIKADGHPFMAIMPRSYDKWSLKFASTRLRMNRDVALAVATHQYRCMEYISNALRCDRDFVLQAVAVNGMTLAYMLESLMDDREVVFTAVQQDGIALAFASNRLKEDKEIVLAAVIQNGMALEYAAEELRSDKEIVLLAAKQDAEALQFASSELVLALDELKGIVSEQRDAVADEAIDRIKSIVENGNYETL